MDRHFRKLLQESQSDLKIEQSTDAADSATVQWSGLQNLLEHAESDVLILLDCCAAASSISGTGCGVTEVIAACGFETWAPGVGEHSFTRSLIDELRYWGQGSALSVAMLHNKVLSRIKYWKPRFGSTGEHEHRKTPIYIVLANEEKQRSIALEPLTPTDRTTSVELTTDPDIANSPSDGSTSSHVDTDKEAQSSSQSSLDQIWPDEKFLNPKVLLSIALEEEQGLRMADWLDWLSTVPAIVKYAHVEGIYKSGSTLMLLSLPIAIWDLLPKNPAMQFIGFTRSPNLLRTNAAVWAESSDAVPATTMVSYSKPLRYAQDFRTDEFGSEILPVMSQSIPDPTAYQQSSDMTNFKLQELEHESQAALKSTDIVNWLNRSELTGKESVDAPPHRPMRLRKRILPESGDTLTDFNLRKVAFNPPDSHILDPGFMVDENLSDEDISDKEDRTSTDELVGVDSPVPHQLRPIGAYAHMIPREAKVGLNEPLDQRPPLYRVKLWQDPLYDSSNSYVKLQPATANAAMRRYEERAREIDNVSCAATWGSRRSSISDISGLLLQPKSRDFQGSREKLQRGSAPQQLPAGFSSKEILKHEFGPIMPGGFERSEGKGVIRDEGYGSVNSEHPDYASQQTSDTKRLSLLNRALEDPTFRNSSVGADMDWQNNFLDNALSSDSWSQDMSYQHSDARYPSNVSERTVLDMMFPDPNTRSPSLSTAATAPFARHSKDTNTSAQSSLTEGRSAIKSESRTSEAPNPPSAAGLQTPDTTPSYGTNARWKKRKLEE